MWGEKVGCESLGKECFPKFQAWFLITHSLTPKQCYLAPGLYYDTGCKDLEVCSW